MYKNILIPVALDRDHDTKASFEAARHLADADTKFTILHVREPIPAYVASQIPECVFENTRHEPLEELHRKASELPDASARLISGHPGRAIVDFANENEIDCISIASHKPGLENIFVGSTANKVVHHAKCPVHGTP
ncbi:universal stress protein [Ruegeria sp. AD91A]|uniref:universal stress protein n=1 Tax=Ruegeria sp. AD91A TaxID=2293862 RepID=UPI000E510053|nr:universal stress protein [Ruegeria sp. AD91A]AXT27067.1 universal stress protein [Ruegeria sp. AD91A]